MYHSLSGVWRETSQNKSITESAVNVTTNATGGNKTGTSVGTAKHTVYPYNAFLRSGCLLAMEERILATLVPLKNERILQWTLPYITYSTCRPTICLQYSINIS